MKPIRCIKDETTRGLAILACLVVLLSFGCSKRRAPSLAPSVEAAALDPMKEAVRLVEEDRGEAMGRKASVETPSELQHYRDRRRFLAVQTAAWRETGYALPHDFAELAELIKRGELVEIEPLGDDYVLYGVGDAATDDALTHYDETSHESIPLCSTDEDFRREDERLTEAIGAAKLNIAALTKDLRATGRRDRATRKLLSARIAHARASAAADARRQKVLQSISKDPDQRARLRSECRSIELLAADFGGHKYDLADPASRKQLKIKLLSFMRPEARDVLLEIAHAYKQKFSRCLAITSLVRTEEYQHLLSEWNRNAARNSAPPHTTGLAFDIYYKFMSASEQDYLMSVIAGMKDAGRVEALRETRDHIHVFAFATGRPNEIYVAQAIAATPSKTKLVNVKRAPKRAPKRANR